MKILAGVIIIFATVIIIKLAYTQKQPEDIEAPREVAEGRAVVKPPKPFTTDGCTFFPESLFGKDLSNMCIEHDMEYWKGGTRDEREKTDIKLRDDANKIMYPLGHIMYAAVRIFGHPKVPGPWRWGYGFDYPYPNEY